MAYNCPAILHFFDQKLRPMPDLDNLIAIQKEDHNTKMANMKTDYNLKGIQHILCKENIPPSQEEIDQVRCNVPPCYVETLC